MPRFYTRALLGALSVASLISFALIGHAAPVPRHLMKPPTYYFPTKLGATITYQEPGSDTQRTLVVTSVADHDDVKTVSLGLSTPDGIVGPYLTMTVTGGGLYCIQRGNHKLDTPEVWLQLPAERDRCWEYCNGSTKVTSTICGEEDMTVPAGTFHCVRVQTRQNDRIATYWFAPEVGLVRTDAANWTEELKSFTPGKD